ncbi:hypothetical protein EVAR_18171_1 [Eumeta japonica]|uniref:Uncharacterized protein n=1 Tax=Eumeta variegata TaxID=151549 RepID=A0A4C1UWK4_EUMVA|nr:hypothetical protein EVAR_18171_1 [Eumeta japonica]
MPKEGSNSRSRIAIASGAEMRIKNTQSCIEESIRCIACRTPRVTGEPAAQRNSIFVHAQRRGLAQFGRHLWCLEYYLAVGNG